MKKHKTKLTLLFTFIAMLSVAAVLADWKIMDDYTIKFSGSGAEGTFKGLEGTVVFDANHLDKSFFNVTVDARTISTGNKTKDRHARGSSWFDVEKYPKIGFESSAFMRVGSGYQVTGMLNMHGIKKEITIPFTFSGDNNSGFFEGNFKVNRKDFGINGPFLAFTVGDEFEVHLKVPVRQ